MWLKKSEPTALVQAIVRAIERLKIEEPDVFVVVEKYVNQELGLPGNTVEGDNSQSSNSGTPPKSLS